MAGNRSASLSLLEKSDRFQLSGSGWSVGHDPKSGKKMQPHGISNNYYYNKNNKKHFQ